MNTPETEMHHSTIVVVNHQYIFLDNASNAGFAISGTTGFSTKQKCYRCAGNTSNLDGYKGNIVFDKVAPPNLQGSTASLHTLIEAGGLLKIFSQTDQGPNIPPFREESCSNDTFKRKIHQTMKNDIFLYNFRLEGKDHFKPKRVRVFALTAECKENIVRRKAFCWQPKIFIQVKYDL
jgi:hypothetical protein